MTKEALEKSIAHWEEVVREPKDTPFGSDHCALCGVYYDYEEGCEGCPVRIVTGEDYCRKTPFCDFEYAFEMECGEKTLRNAAQAELDFLKSLRSQYEEKAS